MTNLATIMDTPSADGRMAGLRLGHSDCDCEALGQQARDVGMVIDLPQQPRTPGATAQTEVLIRRVLW